MGVLYRIIYIVFPERVLAFENSQVTLIIQYTFLPYKSVLFSNISNQSIIPTGSYLAKLFSLHHRTYFNIEKRL